MDLSYKSLFLMLCGAIFVGEIAFHLYKCAKFAVQCHIIPRIIRRDLKKTYGTWAVVTGASSGIGHGIANNLAKQGFNIALISRCKDKLNNVASNIESSYGVKTKIIESDASSRETYEYVLQQLHGMDIGILVNNVGIIAEDGVQSPPFHDTKFNRVYDMMTVNCGTASILMKGLLPHMMVKGKGLVVNMTSSSVYTPLPYQAQYSATKIYLDLLSESLREEVKSSGVTVKTVRTFIVKTKMTATNSLAFYSPLALTSDTYPDHLMPTLNNDLTTCGYWLADLTIWSFRIFPQWYKTSLSTLMIKYAMKHGNIVKIED